MRVLGIDPGLTRCGLGVVEGPGSDPAMVTVEVVRTDRDDPLPQRLALVYDRVTAAVAGHAPDAVAVEQVLFSRNVRTAAATGQAAGVAMLAGAHAGVPVVTYAPTRIKLAVAGHGAADKDAVTRMVTAQLGLDSPPRPADAADALATALCHLAVAGPASSGAADAPGTWGEAIDGNPHVRVAGGTGGGT